MSIYLEYPRSMGKNIDTMRQMAFYMWAAPVGTTCLVVKKTGDIVITRNSDSLSYRKRA